MESNASGKLTECLCPPSSAKLRELQPPQKLLCLLKGGEHGVGTGEPSVKRSWDVPLLTKAGYSLEDPASVCLVSSVSLLVHILIY